MNQPHADSLIASRIAEGRIEVAGAANRWSVVIEIDGGYVTEELATSMVSVWREALAEYLSEVMP